MINLHVNSSSQIDVFHHSEKVDTYSDNIIACMKGEGYIYLKA